MKLIVILHFVNFSSDDLQNIRFRYIKLFSVAISPPNTVKIVDHFVNGLRHLQMILIYTVL